MRQKKLELNGNKLKIRDLHSMIADEKITVEIPDSVLSVIEKSHTFLLQELDKRIIYGSNTGFGPMASHVLGRKQLSELQKNLILSHAVGMGEAIRPEYVLATMVVRLNSLTKGFSGVSVELIKHLATFINHRILPVVPEHGAVGASGDLVQLAHIALALLGKGQVFYKGEKHSASKILRKLGLKPYTLLPKEGLSLINGTSAMTGIGSLVYLDASRLLSLAIHTGALALELVKGFNDSISEKLNALRPHPGQIQIAKRLREILASSKLLRDRRKLKNFTSEKEHEIPETVQEIYSLRCIPQILGPVLETLLQTGKVLETEMNSVTDNPIVDWEGKLFLHGGNFHGDEIAASLDQLKMVLVKMTMLSERRINFFLNKNINKYFPPFLNLRTPGLTLGLQGLQFVATSTTAQSQSLAFPNYVHSIPTNGDNQDLVSMGSDSSLLAAKVIDNAYVVLAIELITLAQAVDFLGGSKKFSTESKKLFATVRKIIPKIEDDRVLVAELDSIVKFLKNNEPDEFRY